MELIIILLIAAPIAIIFGVRLTIKLTTKEPPKTVKTTTASPKPITELPVLKNLYYINKCDLIEADVPLTKEFIMGLVRATNSYYLITDNKESISIFVKANYKPLDSPMFNIEWREQRNGNA